MSFVLWAQEIITMFGYAGLFFVAFLSTISVFLPTFPLSILVFLSGAVLNPLIVGLAAGFGSATGELIGFFIGRGGEKILLKKYDKKIKHIEKLFQKYKGEFVIFFLAAIPIVPFDVVGLFCGIIGFDVKKFYTFLLLGKCVRYTTIAVAGFYGTAWILNYLGITI